MGWKKTQTPFLSIYFLFSQVIRNLRNFIDEKLRFLGSQEGEEGIRMYSHVP